MHTVGEGCFAVTVLATPERSQASTLKWLSTDAQHILRQAPLDGGWTASSFHGPNEMLDTPGQHAITMYYTR